MLGSPPLLDCRICVCVLVIPLHITIYCMGKCKGHRHYNLAARRCPTSAKIMQCTVLLQLPLPFSLLASTTLNTQPVKATNTYAGDAARCTGSRRRARTAACLGAYSAQEVWKLRGIPVPENVKILIRQHARSRPWEAVLKIATLHVVAHNKPGILVIP
jgi:hypothetical protein